MNAFLRITLSAISMLALCACGGKSHKPAAPAERGEVGGLAAYWWVVDEARSLAKEPIAKALAPYMARPVPADRAQVRLWRENGLRIVSVPRGDVEALREKFNLIGPTQEQWFGQLPRWSGVWTGPSWRGRQPIMLDNGPLVLSAGALRLLARCWVAPTEPAADGPNATMQGVLELELVPQHQESLAATTLEDALNMKPRPVVTDEGLVLSRLALSLRAEGADAYLVLYEDPTVEWGTSRKPGDGDATGEAPAREDAPVEFKAPPTLGEAALTDALGGAAGRRVVLVLMPRAPRRFELLPD